MATAKTSGSQPRNSWRRVAETVGIVGSTLLGGLLLKQVEVIFGFTGAVASTTISYILPALIYLRLRPRSEPNGHNYAFLVLGFFLGVVSVSNQFVDVFSR